MATGKHEEGRLAEGIRPVLLAQLRDAHSAEKQALRAMAQVARRATARALQEAVRRHVAETEGQLGRLEQALRRMGATPAGRGAVCEGMRGIVEEAQGALAEHRRGALMDALIVAGLRRVEHYEIAA